MDQRVFNAQWPSELLFERGDGGPSPLARNQAKGGISSGTTDGALISATSGKKIRIVQALITSGASSATYFTIRSKPAGAGTSISADHQLPVGSILLLPFNPWGWWESTISQGIAVNTGSDSVFIDVSYVLL